MIASLTGILKSKSPTEVLVDVNGVGYAVSIPLSTFERLGTQNSHITLYTHLVVREDAMQLFGFATEEERSLFRLLISVNGIGPKIAQAVLSGLSVAELKQHVAGGNIAALTAIPNVGRKTAERLVLELRDKIDKVPTAEALLALTSLGYQRTAAEKAIRQALNETDGASLTVEELIKRGLQHTHTK
jgi:Holliday junction DNA helicase RuvA